MPCCSTTPTTSCEAPGPTFDGRDVFAPGGRPPLPGVPLDELGTEIDPATMMPATYPAVPLEDGRPVTEVLWVDRYGNAQLNLDPDELDALGERFEVRLGPDPRRRGRTRPE